MLNTSIALRSMQLGLVLDYCCVESSLFFSTSNEEFATGIKELVHIVDLFVQNLSPRITRF